MNNNETMSREEIMEAIETGDRHAGVLFEDIEGQLKTALEDHDRIDKKIDAVDTKLEDFCRETDRNFNFVFEEMRAMRKEFIKKLYQSDKNFAEIFKRFDKLDKTK